MAKTRSQQECDKARWKDFMRRKRQEQRERKAAETRGRSQQFRFRKTPVPLPLTQDRHAPGQGVPMEINDQVATLGTAYHPTTLGNKPAEDTLSDRIIYAEGPSISTAEDFRTELDL